MTKLDGENKLLVDEFDEKWQLARGASHRLRVKDCGLIKETRLFQDMKEVNITKQDFSHRSVQLFSDRRQLMISLRDMLGSEISVGAEIGVLHGDFTKFLLETFDFSEFHIFDRDFSKLRQDLSPWAPTRHEGNSSVRVSELFDCALDFAYIDGDHSYRGVSRDVESLLPKMRDRSVIVFNDYSNFNPAALVPYGVMSVAHELINASGYKILSLCLRGNGLNDLCLCRGFMV